MSRQASLQEVQGFLLLSPAGDSGYRGVDREPFEPSVEPEEFSASPSKASNAPIWELYPRGWRRDLYRLYEQNAVPGADFLIAKLEPARDLMRRLDHLGRRFELVHARLWGPDFSEVRPCHDHGRWLGYDIAYPGGDFYAALRNGLLTKPNPRLQRDFLNRLNSFRLFADPSDAVDFLRNFRENVPSERDAEFLMYGLESVNR